MAALPCCRNVFVLLPLAGRLMLLSRAATAAPALAPGDFPAAPLAARDAAAAAAAAARGIPLLWGPPGSHAAASAAAAAAAEATGWRWEASEVYDITGDISYKLACCFMLLYGQPLLPRQPPPLDKLTIQTTKEKLKNTFIEVSLPTTMLGVYIHRSVQRCTGWSLHENSFAVHSLLIPSRETREFARFAVSAVDLFCFNSQKPPEGSKPASVPPLLTDCVSSMKVLSRIAGDEAESLWECVGDPLAAPAYLRGFLIDSNGVGSVSPFCLSPHPSRPCCLPSLLSVCSYTRAEELSILSPPPKPHFPLFLQFLHAQRHPQLPDRIVAAPLSTLQQHNVAMQQLLQQQTALLLLLLPPETLQHMRMQAVAEVGGQMPPVPLVQAAFQVSPASLVPFSAFAGASAAVAAAAVALLASRPLHLLPASLRQYPLHLLLQLLQSQRSAAAESEALERVGLAARAVAGGPSTNPLLWEALRSVLLELTLLLSDRFASAAGPLLQQQSLDRVIAEGDKVPSASVLLLLFSQAFLVANVTAELWRTFLERIRERTPAANATRRQEDQDALIDTVKAFSPKHLGGTEAEWSYLSAKTDALLLLLLQFSHFHAPAAAPAEATDAPTPIVEDGPSGGSSSNSSNGNSSNGNSSSNGSSSNGSSTTSFAAATAALQLTQWWRRVGDCRRLSCLFCLSSLSGKGEELSERQQQIKQQRGLSVNLSTPPLSRAKEWVEPPAFFFSLLLIRSKCFRRIAAAAAAGSNDTATAVVAAVAAAAEAAHPRPLPDVARLVAAAASASAATAGGASSNSAIGDSKPAAPQPGAGGSAGKASASPTAPTASSLYAVALCDAADALLVSCVQAFGADSILGGEVKSALLSPSSSRSTSHAQRVFDTSSSSSRHGGMGTQAVGNPPSAVSCRSAETVEGATGEALRFVCSQVSLQLYLQHAGDIESLVEAEGDPMPQTGLKSWRL
ncbi:uncharacterized protein LOC113147525 [Cyclospora cayetanensis]|uniref:Uncharacterized protein LOC113147525 n=1 Tax=Cyclospora cayetanensis TaxID=88456 RepID=A0A6P6S376_9EIME|nr:uncharacterized protein LOC113147525 [Cyclospora cayetanensis]